MMHPERLYRDQTVCDASCVMHPERLYGDQIQILVFGSGGSQYTSTEYTVF